MELIVNIILFLAGLIIGNWFAIGRDKRKEFNDIADSIYLKLKNELDNVESIGPLAKGPSQGDLDILSRRISPWKRKKLNKAIRDYNDSKSSDNRIQDGYGQQFYDNPEKVISSIQSLTRFTTRK